MKNQKWLVLLVVVMLITVAFEAAQQLFYVRRYAINPEATFTDLFQNHFIRWLVWLLFAYVVWRLARFLAGQSRISFRLMAQSFMVIVGLVAASILLISVIEYVRSGNEFVAAEFWSEWALFFMFQKAPIYTLAYVCFLLIGYYYHLGHQIQVESLRLDELNKEQQQKLDQLKQQLHGAKQFLNVKVGQKQHLIPVSEVSWLEADNYCVNVHTSHITPYALRVSLKAMESQLPPQFVRVHRKAIVNMNQVRAFVNAGSNHLVLNDGTEVKVAMSKTSYIKSYLKQLTA